MAAARDKDHPGAGAKEQAEAGPGLLGGWTAAGAGKPRKRSLSIAGHRTAISLEEPFWEALRRIAWGKRAPIARLVAEIDAVRGETSLSSAIRLFVLDVCSREPRRA
jgi:predicted DNA-binding ribbon-helix-helix protein